MKILKMVKQNILKAGILVFVLFLLVIGLIYFIKPKQEKVENKEVFSSEDVYLDFINKNMVSGGPGKDGIPAIDKPQYVRVEEADEFLDDEDKVFGFEYNGVVKAFPKSILYWHEIVNDEVNGEIISVSYCPLTETVIGFKEKNLGVSGKLYNSNLVVYDRETGSEMPQILQKAVNGELKGERLKNFYVYTTTWNKWKKRFPNSLVLSENTGYDRDYDRNPYPGYDDALRLWFPVASESDRFHSKKIIHGVENNGGYLAIPKEEFKKVGEIKYKLGGDELLIEYDEELGVIKVFKDKEQINSFDSYWFAWYAYHPDTKIYGG